ncbi:MAG: redoxin domain-containing protein [candidate division Zixibacteria bacterium]|nr:redoxin domain-containing protein [candidate division Zixibacteria bacterium]
MRTRLITLAVITAFVVGGLAGCSQQTATGDSQTSSIETPKIYDAELAGEYRQLSSTGYDYLDEGELDSAVATFTRQAELIPEGKWGQYNVACAYGRTGNTDKAIEWLTKAVDGGHDDPRQIESDPDLSSLHDDPRFDALVARARENMERNEAAFANGLPHYDNPPQEFASEEELQAWQQEQENKLRASRAVWHNSQFVAAQMDYTARVLAAKRALNADNPEYEPGLERVRAIARIKSVYQPWGPFADGVIKEVNAYLSNDPSPAGKDEANYWAGVAAFCKHRPESAMDANWASTETAARGYFNKVGSESDYAGAANAWLLHCDLIAAGKNKDEVMPKVRTFGSEFADDSRAMGIAGVLFQEDMVEAKWPIPIEAVDIDDKPVSLDQYEGKVLLVDFWATWCGPCRVELPHIIEAYETYNDDGFDILSISLDYGERTTTEQYKEWIADKGMDEWRHIYDKKSWESPLVDAYMVRGIPNPVLIGPDGSLAAIGDDLRGENLIKTIQRVLEEQGV